MYKNIVGLLIFVTVVSCAGLYSQNSNVVQLTKQNFAEQVFGSSQIWLVEFYAPWCGHCKNLAPAWDQAATSLKGIANIAAVNCDEHRELAGLFDVKGFPTIIFFGSEQSENPKVRGQPWKKPEVYQGGRSAADITNFILSKLPNYVITAPKLKEALEDNYDLDRVVLFSDKTTTSNFYKGLAVEYKDRLAFLQVHKANTEVVTKFGIESYPSVVLFTKTGEQTKYEGKLSPSDLAPFKKFLDKHAPPPKAGSSGSKSSTTADRPLEVTFIDSAEDFEKNILSQSGTFYIAALDKENSAETAEYLKITLLAAEKFKQYRFFWFDGPSHGDFLRNLRIDSGYPQLFALNPKKNAFASFIGAYTKDNIFSFVDRVTSGSRRLIQKLDTIPAF